jgi:hypothetical protein
VFPQRLAYVGITSELFRILYPTGIAVFRIPVGQVCRKFPLCEEPADNQSAITAIGEEIHLWGPTSALARASVPNV